MKLRYSPTSPFVRKVWVMALETGLDDRIERIQVSPVSPDDIRNSPSPLGKIPCLETDDGLVLYDSPVICEYLDTLHQGPRVFPGDGPPRWEALRQQALCDGILDAAVLRRLEHLRPETLRSPDWVALQEDTVRRSVAVLANDPTAIPPISAMWAMLAA